jgi:hypothetical protein
MVRNPAVVRLFFFLCGLPFLYYVLTGKEHDNIYTISLALIVIGAIVGMVLDWRAGHKRRVYTRLIIYGIILAVALAAYLVRSA